MKAMILAAGLGTRLKPLTETRPKALVEVGGKPMILNVIEKLRSEGFDDITVNVHHFAKMLKDFLSDNDFGVRITISDEEKELLDTGGGIVKASEILFGENESPVLVHNVDIISNADLKALMENHIKDGNKATLLVSKRESSRKLIFDKNMELKGWRNIVSGEIRPQGLPVLPDDKDLAFSGIYVIGKECVDEMREIKGEGKFSIMDYFLCTRRKQTVKGVEMDSLELTDIGKPETLRKAELK